MLQELLRFYFLQKTKLITSIPVPNLHSKHKQMKS